MKPPKTYEVQSFDGNSQTWVTLIGGTAPASVQLEYDAYCEMNTRALYRLVEIDTVKVERVLRRQN